MGYRGMFLTEASLSGVWGSLIWPPRCPVLQEATSELANVWFGCNGEQEDSGVPVGDSSEEELGENVEGVQSGGDVSNVAAR